MQNSCANVIDTPVQTFTNLASTEINLNFATYNSSLGQLTSVEVVLENVTLSGTAMGTNNSGSNPPEVGGPETIRIFLTGTIDVTAVDNIDVNLSANSPYYVQYNVPINGTISNTFTNAAGSPSGNTQTITGTPPSYSEVAGYEGDGVTTVPVTVTPSFFGVSGVATASPGSTANYVSASYNGSATASGTVYIEYTYTPAPEPAETAAWMLGLGICIILGRKYLPRRLSSVRAD